MKLNIRLAKRILGDVSEGSRFFCNDGKFFSNLCDLKEDFGGMSNEAFFHHTGEGRNDFSNWIRDCLGDEKLADELAGLDKESSLKKIGARITYVEKYLAKKV